MFAYEMSNHGQPPPRPWLRPPRPARAGTGESLAVIATGITAFAAFAFTAYPSITWWDSSNYSLAAATLGITTPPGSFLLTLIGWLVTRLPWPAAPARVLNLTGGALAAATVAMTLLLALRLLRRTAPEPRARHPWHAIGAAAGALTFAFTPTLWGHAVKFTPYILTAVVTTLILWNMLLWWQEADDPGAWRRLLLLGLLFGLDFSVHRTNLLLLPGLALWILVRRPRTLGEWRAWLGGIGGVAMGLTLQLALIPLAATHPWLDAGDPETWRRFYDYVSLAQYGGGFLVQFYPRHAPLWSVQFADLARQFAANFVWGRGWMALPGLLPFVLGIAGFVTILRRDRRLGVALVAVLLVHAVTTVFYFNIPANFFRPFDRHYLPIFTLFAVMIGVGAGQTARLVAAGVQQARWRPHPGWALLLLGVVPASLFAHNLRAIDGSRRYFARDFAANLLGGLPSDAIVFTSGDNDTWPLLYLQGAERVRTDVQVVNLPLTNTDWYLPQIAARDSTFPLTVDELPASTTQPWSDSTVSIAVEGTAAHFDLPPDAVLPDAIGLQVTPTLGDRFILRQDLVLLRLLQENRWRRPVCFSATAAAAAVEWFGPWRRLNGVSWCVVPLRDPPVDRMELRRNVLDRYTYRGYADARLALDDFERVIGTLYRNAFIALGQADLRAGDEAACRETRARMLGALPLSRVAAAGETQGVIDRLCDVASPSPR